MLNPYNWRNDYKIIEKNTAQPTHQNNWSSMFLLEIIKGKMKIREKGYILWRHIHFVLYFHLFIVVPTVCAFIWYLNMVFVFSLFLVSCVGLWWNCYLLFHPYPAIYLCTHVSNVHIWANLIIIYFICFLVHYRFSVSNDETYTLIFPLHQFHYHTLCTGILFFFLFHFILVIFLRYMSLSTSPNII